MPGDTPKLLTIKETAAILRVSRPTVYRLMRAGQLRTVKLGGSRRVSPRELEQLIDRKTK